MKKWDDVNRLKQHNRRIINARSILPPMNIVSSQSRGAQKRKPSSESQVTEKTSSTKVLKAPPAKKPLRNMVSPLQSTQIYYQSYQSQQSQNVRVNFPAISTKQAQLQEVTQVVPIKQKIVRVQKLGLDFFNNGDQEFSSTLQQVLEKYQSEKMNLSQSSTSKTVKKLSPSRNFIEPVFDIKQKLTIMAKTPPRTTFRRQSQQIINPRSKERQDLVKNSRSKENQDIIARSKENQELVKNSKSKEKSELVKAMRSEQQPQPKLQAQAKKPPLESHTKQVPPKIYSVITKKTKKRGQDDINLIEEYKDHNVVTQIRETKLIQNLKKIIGCPEQSKEFLQSRDLDKPNIYMDAVKLMYISFDSIQMTSTLMNLDVEEMCNCLGWAIQNHINFGVINQNKQIELEEQQDIIKSQIDAIADDDPQIKIIEQDEQKYNNQVDNGETFSKVSEDDYEPEPEQHQHLYDEDGNDMDYREYQSINVKSSLALQNLIVQYQDPRHSLGAISEKTFETSHQPEQNRISIFNIEKPQQSSYIHHLQSQEKKGSVKEISKDYECEFDLDDPQQHHDPIHHRSPSIYQSTSQLPGEVYSPYTKNSDHHHQASYQSFIKDITNLDISLESKFDMVDQDEYDMSVGQRLRRAFKKVFDENDPFQCIEFWMYSDIELVIPTVEVICNYCKNILITAKMEKEVAIICLVYIERILITSGLSLTTHNWRKLTFTALILGSKIWDDESFENNNFSKAFPQFTTTQINELERIFLQMIDYNLYVKSSEYAKYYFLLRTYAEKKKKSFPLRSLDVRTILHLQRNSNKAEKILIDQYKDPMNKSF